MSNGANALGAEETSEHAEAPDRRTRQGDGDAFAASSTVPREPLPRGPPVCLQSRRRGRGGAGHLARRVQGIWAFEGRSSLKTWIFRILINRAKTRAAREGRTVPFDGFGGDNVGAPEAAVSPDRFWPADHPTEPGHWASPPRDFGASPEHRLLGREAGEQLQKAIDRLPPNQRLVLTLRDIEGCSTEEVSNALGIQETNGRVLLHRARAKVRAALEPYLEGG